MKNNLELDFQNPCELPMLRKLFRPRVTISWNILEKETVDEIIFRTTNIRNRLILELMARGGMRIGEVLKLRLCDIQDRKLNGELSGLVAHSATGPLGRLVRCYGVANTACIFF